MKAQPGTYALILQSHCSKSIAIGKWGTLKVKPGLYIYVGSAFGPGGVRARVLRHWRKTRATHWHIDYLRGCVDPVCAWHCYGPRALEHQLAAAISALDGVSPVDGFGSSDCQCISHLFMASAMPETSALSKDLGVKIHSSDFLDGE